LLISWVEFPEACFGFDLSVQYVFQNAPELAPGFFTIVQYTPQPRIVKVDAQSPKFMLRPQALALDESSED